MRSPEQNQREIKEPLKKEVLRLLIIGGGIVGNSLALQLADKGFHPTIISRTGLTPSDILTRRSMPVVRQNTASMLSIPFDAEQAANQFRLAGKGKLISSIVGQVSGLRKLRQNPLIALDINLAEKELHDRVTSNPNITVISGSFMDVEIQKDRITGVILKEGGDKRVLQADLVIDTTGKTASVAKSVENKRPGSIQETLSDQSNGIIGGYIAFTTEGIEKLYPNVKRTMYAGILLDNNNTISLYPATKDHTSQATHLILVGGNHLLMHEAYVKALRKEGKDANLLRARLEVLDFLTQGSPWNKLIKNITYMDRTIFFKHEHAAKLSVENVKGLVLMGDAVVHINPISALGLSHAAQDIDLFVKKLETVATKDGVDKFVENYNHEQSLKTDKRLIAAEKLYRKAHRFVKVYQITTGLLRRKKLT